LSRSAGRPRLTGREMQPGPLLAAIKLSVRPLSLASSAPGASNERGSVMSKSESDADKSFRSSDRPLTEYEQEQKALRKNLERLKAERLAREAEKSKDA
jgi:hypothetical protein